MSSIEQKPQGCEEIKPTEAEINLTKFSDELKMARGLVNGSAPPWKTINKKNFSVLAEFAPETLLALSEMAHNNFLADIEQIEANAALREADVKPGILTDIDRGLLARLFAFGGQEWLLLGISALRTEDLLRIEGIRNSAHSDRVRGFFDTPDDSLSSAIKEESQKLK